MSLLSHTHLQDEEAAYAWVEAHVWPEGPVCPKCGSVERISKMAGKATRYGLYKCYACRSQFRVTVSTIFEKSHVPLHIWLQAFFLMAGSKKGISSNQLHRTLGVTLKTAWFMSHRIREAMRDGGLAPPMGSAGGVVEIDETIYGRAATHPKGRGPHGAKLTGASHKNVVLALVERGGKARSYHIEGSSAQQVLPIVHENVSHEAQVMTDSAQLYKYRLGEFASHERVDHGKSEYARYEEGRPVISTNTLRAIFRCSSAGCEGLISIAKRSICIGISRSSTIATTTAKRSA